LMIWMINWMEVAPMWMSRFRRMGVIIGMESLGLSLKLRSKIKFS
jgi:hypothetical protein